ncbi:MAG: YARHG domain-containing protein, partial [Candidatus Delongbacteria bacterium]|nr:YARHG domain-containing protein [Candidatus Delongbacteria bacterium]
YVSYYFNQMKIHNSFLKKKSKYYLARKRFLTNFIYALNGYDFKDDKWEALFKCFKWYKPTTTAPVLSEEEQKIINEIKNL